jgi:hypothetical protein
VGRGEVGLEADRRTALGDGLVQLPLLAKSIAETAVR